MSTILQDSEIPLYMQVSEWVHGKIYKGELGKGDRIPSENQIMRNTSGQSGHGKERCHHAGQ